MKKPDACEDFKLPGNFRVPEHPVCHLCLETGSDWLHLRTCQSCGITLCCDNSPYRHMTAHCINTSHPTIISAEPGERWVFCYRHNLFSDY
jgi:hypothetical protein